MSESAIRISGLKEFTRAVKELDANMPKLIRVAMNEAADAVIGEARPEVPSRSGRAARSMRAQSTRKEVRVVAGGPRAPYYPWLDFGGRVGRRKATVRRFYADGRYLYPAYFRLRDNGRFVDIMSRALVDVAEKAGLKVDHD